MPSVTIIGAGVFGLSIAQALPRSFKVTVVARDLPGDPESLGWASPWAGAGFGGGSSKNPEEIEMLKASFRYFWELAETNPESTVKRIKEVLFRDNTHTDEDLWWKDFMPNYRILSPSELPPECGAKIGISHDTIVLTAPAYIVWLKQRLEASGVVFVRKTVESIGELKGTADVVVNATGVGAQTLGGVEDADVETIRGQTMVIKSSIDKMLFRTGNDYCYIIPRLDGTVIIGGIKQFGETDGKVDPALRDDICRRAHQLEPSIPTSHKELEILRDIVGIRPGRKSGLRVEAEVIEGQPVVHAYGGAGGGFALSAGVGRRVAILVDQFIQSSQPWQQ